MLAHLARMSQMSSSYLCGLAPSLQGTWIREPRHAGMCARSLGAILSAFELWLHTGVLLLTGSDGCDMTRPEFAVVLRIPPRSRSLGHA